MQLVICREQSGMFVRFFLDDTPPLFMKNCRPFYLDDAPFIVVEWLLSVLPGRNLIFNTSYAAE